MSEAEIHVSIDRQILELREQGQVVACWPVSTALKGAGNTEGSQQTPLGRHRIRARIGTGQPLNSVFRGRRPTGEIYSAAIGAEFPGRDWILTRILWLCGEEKGFNRGGNVDSQRRYIYIHGTPDSEPMGEPRSHGCIRMRNQDLLALFDRVPVGTPVIITQD
ncbi:MAG TPA: L,D-transpeptidase [Dongiaceae bacterium]|nr:L,D-transpeptidase [Dongiaceae bacterium]